MADERLAQDGGSWPDCPRCGLPVVPRGLGTALKPSHEPIVVARKPFTSTVAANVQTHGTGALNIDGCRIEGEPRATGTVNPHAESGVNGIYGSDPRTDRQQRYDANLPEGRWPANVALDEAAAEELDRQSGELHSQDPTTRNRGRKPGWSPSGTDRPLLDKDNPNGGDTGGASRFFYTAKASRGERNAGLDGFAERALGGQLGQREGTRMGRSAEEGANVRESVGRNIHPTVKPIALMRWLCRLVAPPDGLILDPFTGSGTTGCAAVLEDFNFLGIEREAEYVEIARARIDHWNRQPKQHSLFEAAA